MDFYFTPNQRQLMEKLKYWYHNKTKPYFSYSGAAGTGKSTIIKAFIEEIGLPIHKVAAAAYVGKAVLVLLRHGLNASTIHSLIYRAVYEAIPEEELEPDENGHIKKRGRMRFVLREELKENIKLIVIDEASMVNDKLRDDILSFGIPVVFIGDNNQLPPIFGKSSVMEYPDHILYEIMRQEENSPVVYLSQCVLNDIPLQFGTYGKSKIINSIDINKNILTDYDIIICGKNKTREKINNDIRHNVLGIISNDPIIGDKIINRQNDWEYCVNDIYLTNGTIGFITDIDYSTLCKNYITLDFRPDFMLDEFQDLRLDYKYFNTDISKRNGYGISKYNKFEYGYCITAHLSQGSEYDRVLFIDQPFYDKETTKKLRYTAITRARDSITIVKNSWEY